MCFVYSITLESSSKDDIIIVVSNMKQKIENEQIEFFSKCFNKIKDKNLQKILANNSILDVALNEKIKKENKFEFNIELEEGKIYNQGDCKRCWIFGALNLIKNNMAHNLNQNVMEFELSPNYLNFFDKLEKANHAYQVIIDSEIDEKFLLCDYEDHPILTGYLKDPVRENGKVAYAHALLRKYGIVPISVMPETYNSLNSDDFNKWYTRKIHLDMLKLISLKKSNSDLYKEKEKMLKECYKILAYVLGEPPKTFDYTYTDENNKVVKLKNLTPMEFYQKYCSVNLDEYVLIAQIPIFDYYKKYERRYTKNIVEADAHNFINIPQKQFTELCLKQLKSNIPVVIGCDNKKYRDKESKILDTRIFNFDTLFNIKDMTKAQSLETFDCRARHIMTIRGAYVADDNPIRWKVEDSAGENNRINGYYVMNNNYFEKCVFYAWINKKFLSRKLLKVLQEPAILYGFEGSEI